MVVKVYFKNNIIVEGVVLEWSNVSALLKASSSDNKLFIYSPSENVVMVKILEDTMSAEVSPEPEPEPEPILSEMSARAQKLVSLKMKNINSDKFKFAKTLKSESIQIDQGNKYELPNFTKRGPFIRTTAKTR